MYQKWSCFDDLNFLKNVMKSLIIQLLFFLALCREIFTCVEVFEERIEYRWNRFHTRLEKELVAASTTITCSNLSSISDMDTKVFDAPTDHGVNGVFLHIESSTLMTIPPRAFAHMHNITKMYLTENHITTIQLGAFENLTSLWLLKFDQNEVSALPNGIFSPLHKLEILTLNDNKIKQIEDLAFQGLNKLTSLELRNNQLAVFEDVLFETLPNVERLDLSGNPLSKIPAKVADLKIVHLSNISLTQFDIDLSSSLPHPVAFTLSSNLLTTIDISKFKEVNHLDLSKNQIVSLTNLQTSEAISELNLDNNEIVTINGSFQNPLWRLTLRHNKIETLYKSMLNQSTELNLLDLGFNRISDIEKNFFMGLRNLEHLDLDYNNLTKIDADLFHDLVELKSLNLSHNRIETIPFGIFDTLTYLSLFDISNNKLMSLNEQAFSSLKHIFTLNFENNQISSLDAEYLMSNINHLSSVSLDNNHWNCKDLVNITRTFARYSVKIKPGVSHDVENLHGIACINRREFEELNNNSSRQLRAVTDQILKDSLILKKSSNSSGAVIPVIVIQLTVSCLLLFVISLIFVHLKKYLVHPRG